MNTGTIPSKSYDIETWTPDADIIVKKVLVVERSDKSLSNVQAYIKLAGDPCTHDYIPASVLGSDTEYCWKPDERVSKGSEIYIKLLNSSSDDIECDIVIEYERV